MEEAKQNGEAAGLNREEAKRKRETAKQNQEAAKLYRGKEKQNWETVKQNRETAKQNREEDRLDIQSLTLDELTGQVLEMGEKAFRARQLYLWLHRQQARDWDAMSNLPSAFLARCRERFSLTVLRPERCQESALDGTKKFLFALPDGNLVESVWMRYRHGNSVCISSQAGCRMGCRFCASTLDGLARGLTPAEMLEQVYQAGRLTGERVSHVVVMGTGEPLDNYDALLRFLRLLTDENGLHLSQRNVTVSTCGLVPQIYALARERLQITLAISLHAPDDALRRELMPVAQRYGMDELLAACDFYFAQTGRRITFEYALMSGVNDSPRQAEELREKLRGRNCHVNLIPVNPVSERGYRSSSREAVRQFAERLTGGGIPVTVRRELGRDIDGACGQLRRRTLRETPRG